MVALSSRDTASCRGPLAVIALACLVMALAPSTAVAATGSIGGTVTDASTHDPIELAEVCAWLVEEEEEEEEGWGCTHTEEDGTYLLGGLKTGEYKVEFWAKGYSSQYYDGKGFWPAADPVTVESAALTGGIDAELSPMAKIEGTVKATEDGLGVKEVEVCVYPLSPEEEENYFYGCGYSGSDGAYAITGLSPGNYKIEFWPGYTGRNLAYQFYDHQVRYSEADVVSMAEAEDKTEVDADLPPGASINGTVTGAAGQPLEEVRVCSVDAASGKLTICTWTNGEGRYQLRHLVAGSYKVVFSPELSEFFPGEAFPGEDADGLPTQFWDNQTTLAAANVLSLGTGDSANGIDAHFGPLATPPPVTPPTVTPSVHRHEKCPRGKRKRRVHGKVRCVRVHKRRHHGGAGAASTSATRSVRLFAR